MIGVAALLTTLGALALVAAVDAPAWASLMFLAVMSGVVGWLAELAQRLRDIPARLWDARIKKAAAWTPHLLALVAWSALALMLAR